MSASVRSKVLAGTEYLGVAPRVVECAKDVPIDQADLSLHPDRMDLEKIGDLKTRWGLGASVDRLIAVMRGL
jgi:hypothetical protein